MTFHKVNVSKVRKNLDYKVTSYFSKIPIPSHTPDEALKRFTIFTELFYPQYVTWDRLTWEPHPTAKKHLTRWYFFSFFLIMTSLSFFSKILQQILKFEKDPQLSIIAGTFILLFFALSSITVTTIFTFIYKIESLCFVCRNLKNMKNHGKLKILSKQQMRHFIRTSVT